MFSTKKPLHPCASIILFLQHLAVTMDLYSRRVPNRRVPHSYYHQEQQQEQHQEQHQDDEVHHHQASPDHHHASWSTSMTMTTSTRERPHNSSTAWSSSQPHPNDPRQYYHHDDELMMQQQHPYQQHSHPPEHHPYHHPNLHPQHQHQQLDPQYSYPPRQPAAQYHHPPHHTKRISKTRALLGGSSCRIILLGFLCGLAFLGGFLLDDTSTWYTRTTLQRQSSSSSSSSSSLLKPSKKNQQGNRNNKISTDSHSLLQSLQSFAQPSSSLNNNNNNPQVDRLQKALAQAQQRVMELEQQQTASTSSGSNKHNHNFFPNASSSLIIPKSMVDAVVSWDEAAMEHARLSFEGTAQIIPLDDHDGHESTNNNNNNINHYPNYLHSDPSLRLTPLVATVDRRPHRQTRYSSCGAVSFAALSHSHAWDLFQFQNHTHVIPYDDLSHYQPTCSVCWQFANHVRAQDHIIQLVQRIPPNTTVYRPAHGGPEDTTVCLTGHATFTDRQRWRSARWHSYRARRFQAGHEQRDERDSAHGFVWSVWCALPEISQHKNKKQKDPLDNPLSCASLHPANWHAELQRVYLTTSFTVARKLPEAPGIVAISQLTNETLGDMMMMNNMTTITNTTTNLTMTAFNETVPAPQAEAPLSPLHSTLSHRNPRYRMETTWPWRALVMDTRAYDPPVPWTKPTSGKDLKLLWAEGPMWQRQDFDQRANRLQWNMSFAVTLQQSAPSGIGERWLLSMLQQATIAPGSTRLLGVVDSHTKPTYDKLAELLQTPVNHWLPWGETTEPKSLSSSRPSLTLQYLKRCLVRNKQDRIPSDLTLGQLFERRRIDIKLIPFPFRPSLLGTVRQMGQAGFAQWLGLRFSPEYHVVLYTDYDAMPVVKPQKHGTILASSAPFQKAIFQRMFQNDAQGRAPCASQTLKAIEYEVLQQSVDYELQCANVLFLNPQVQNRTSLYCTREMGHVLARSDAMGQLWIHKNYAKTRQDDLPSGVRVCSNDAFPLGGSDVYDMFPPSEVVEVHLRSRGRKRQNLQKCSCRITAGEGIGSAGKATGK